MCLILWYLLKYATLAATAEAFADIEALPLKSCQLCQTCKVAYRNVQDNCNWKD